MECVENEIFKFFLRYVKWFHITNTEEWQTGIDAKDDHPPHDAAFPNLK